MGWQFYDEAIEMMRRRFGYFPQFFLWRGRVYEVDSVDRCWEIGRRRDRPARRCFRVEVGGATLDLYRDLEAGTWHLRRARWYPGSVAAARIVLPTRLREAFPGTTGVGYGGSGP